jgi:hypothetical protein
MSITSICGGHIFRSFTYRHNKSFQFAFKFRAVLSQFFCIFPIHQYVENVQTAQNKLFPFLVLLFYYNILN